MYQYLWYNFSRKAKIFFGQNVSCPKGQWPKSPKCERAKITKVTYISNPSLFMRTQAEAPSANFDELALVTVDPQGVWLQGTWSIA